MVDHLDFEIQIYFYKNFIVMEIITSLSPVYCAYFELKKMMHIFIHKQYYEILQYKQVIWSLNVGLCSKNMIHYEGFGADIASSR